MAAGVVQLQWADANNVKQTQNFWQDASNFLFPMAVVSDGLGNILFTSANPGQVGISQGALGTADSVTVSHTASVAVTFKPSGGTVTIPATPSAYAVGSVIGTQFTIANAVRKSGGGGVIMKATLAEMLGASAYNAQAVTITGSSVTATLASHTLVVGNKIKFGGTPPTNITAGLTYYVQAVPTGNTFNVAATPGGAAITFATAGTSVTITEVPAQLQANLYLYQGAPASTFADNAVFAPTAADYAVKGVPTVQFTNYVLGGQQADADGQYQSQFLCAGSANLAAVLVFAGVAGQTLSKQATLQLTVNINRD